MLDESQAGFKCLGGGGERGREGIDKELEKFTTFCCRSMITQESQQSTLIPSNGDQCGKITMLFLNEAVVALALR